MPAKASKPSKLINLAWLSHVVETNPPLISPSNPISVRHGVISSGPPSPYPECHVCCEFGFQLEGEGINMIEREEAPRRPNELLLLGPGLPHWGHTQKQPYRFITVYFEPSLLIKEGSLEEGMRLLRRFTARQSISDRIVKPPRKVALRLRELFEEILAEFQQQRLGRSIQLRSLLFQQIVLLLRWEESCGIHIGAGELGPDWRPILNALDYISAHYAEQFYARDVARAAGLSEAGLKSLFHQTLGIPWIKYLQGYRVHKAVALLQQSRYNVTETALAVGFESLSHFNATFRSLTGTSPGQFRQATDGEQTLIVGEGAHRPRTTGLRRE